MLDEEVRSPVARVFMNCAVGAHSGICPAGQLIFPRKARQANAKNRESSPRALGLSSFFCVQDPLRGANDRVATKTLQAPRRFPIGNFRFPSFSTAPPSQTEMPARRVRCLLCLSGACFKCCWEDSFAASRLSCELLVRRLLTNCIYLNINQKFTRRNSTIFVKYRQRKDFSFLSR